MKSKARVTLEKPKLGDLPLVVLADHPGLEGREEQGGGHPREETSKHEDVVTIHELDQTGDDIKRGVDDAHLLPSVVVGQGADKRARYHGREESAHVEQGDVSLCEAVKRR